MQPLCAFPVTSPSHLVWALLTEHDLLCRCIGECCFHMPEDARCLQKDWICVYFRTGMQMLNSCRLNRLSLDIKLRIFSFGFLLDACKIVTFEEVRSNWIICKSFWLTFRKTSNYMKEPAWFTIQKFVVAFPHIFVWIGLDIKRKVWNKVCVLVLVLTSK